MAEEKSSKENTGKVYTPQKGLQEFIVKSDVDIMFCGGSMSSGKALSINELVCTPYGFRRMGDIQKGDTITGSDGRPQKVIATYDRGMMDNIELQFSDGRTVQCSRDHLWTVRGESFDWRTIETADIIRFLDNDPNFLFLTPGAPASIEGTDGEIINNPYPYEGQIVGYKVLGQEHMKCIAVSNPDGLFLTRDFIVTHNTFGMILSLAEPIQDPNFRAVFLRRNLAETKTGGGMFDDCKKVYADYIKSAKESDNPRITFNSGAFVEFTHISDETPEKLLERIRGWQFSLILLDEGTSFEWSTFRLLMSRNRSTAKWTNKIRLTCNPKKRHWLRTFLKDYIGPDGFIKPDWDGRVRYLYIKGKNVEDVVWGDTKEEVYAQCKYQIDEAVKKFNEKGGNVDYRSMIKSFTFYLGSPAENKAMIGTNSSYLGSVAAMGEAEARANLLGNWNVDLDEDEEAPLKRADIEAVFDADPQRNNDRWITMDLADTGTDNTLILVWDGFHVIDYKILMKSTPKQNAECVEMMASKHNIGDSHIIYDGVRAAYMLDYIPDAVAYISYRAPLGKYGRMAENLKTECYLRLVEMVKRGRISFDDKIAMSVYQHQNMGVPILFRTEFSEECSVIRFIDLPSGRKRIANKKDMNKMLGKGRSMDLCDPIAMRMMPALGYEYGTELESTFCEEENPDEISDNSVDIYDEATWS